MWINALQTEIYLAPRAIPRSTTSSELHILHHNSFGLLKFGARLLNYEAYKDFLSSWCEPSHGNKTRHKNGSQSDSIHDYKLLTAHNIEKKTHYC